MSERFLSSQDESLKLLNKLVTGSKTVRGSGNPWGLPLYCRDTACASAAGLLLLWSDIRNGEMRNYQCRVRNGCASSALGMHAEKAGPVQSCLKKAEQTALTFLMVTAGQLNETSVLFLPVYPFSFSSLTWGGKKTLHQVPPTTSSCHALYWITRLDSC